MSHHLYTLERLLHAVRVWPPAPLGPVSGSNVARGSSVASGTLRPFGPESGSNVARGSSVLYLTRGG